MTGKDMPWLKSYPAGLDWSFDIPAQTLPQMFDAAVAQWPDRECLRFMGRSWTYRETGKLADRFAKGLQDRGVVRGTKVGLCLPNIPFYVIAYFGALKAGAVVVNFNPLYAEKEIEHQINDSETEIMVTVNVRQVLPKLQKMPGRTALRKIILCDLADALPLGKRLGLRVLNLAKGLTGKADVLPVREDAGLVHFRRLQADAAPAPVALSPQDAAVLQYTGGTTGVPKAAVLSHGNLTANIQQARLWFLAGRGQAEAERMLVILPFFHVFSMTVQMNLTLALGGVIIMLPTFTPQSLLKTIDREKPTMFAGVPSIYKRLMEYPDFKKYDISSLKVCMSGGAGLPAQVRDDWLEMTGLDMVEGYGLSETSPLAIANPVAGLKKPGAIGLPVPRTEVKITDLSYPDKAMPTGQEGEICLRGPQVMTGYWNRPDETGKVLGSDGFLHTGDVGYMDEDGYIFLVDRIKDLIVGDNGLNVFPRRIEDAISQHPAVAEVVVAGVKDAARGEAAKAWVVLKEGHDLSGPDLKAFLKDKLAHYEMPKTIAFRDTLPKTMIGKPDRKALKAEDA